MVNRRFTYTDPTITASKADNTNEFLWLAFSQNSSGNCIIKKVGPFQPDQIFFSIERSVTEVVDMDVSSTHLYVIYNDSTLLIEKFSVNNPLTSTSTANIPVGIDEVPSAVILNGSDLWVLIPGSASGENAKLLKYNTSLTLQETIDLSKSGSTVTDANSFDVDSAGDIWIGTNTDPSTYVRVYELSGGGYDFTVFTV